MYFPWEITARTFVSLLKFLGVHQRYFYYVVYGNLYLICWTFIWIYAVQVETI